MATALKILAISLRYPPYVAGGYELITAEVVETLRERGHLVQVLTGSGGKFVGPDVLPWLRPALDGTVDPLQESLQAGTWERFQLHFFRCANYRSTLRALGRNDFDVVFFFNLGLVSLAPLLAARHRELPTLGYLADGWPGNLWLSSWDGSESGRRKQGQKQLLREVWGSFRSTVGLGPLCACSRFLEREMLDEGLPASDLEVVLPGVPPDMEGWTESLRPRSRSKGEPLKVICASSLWPGKGQHVLIEALARSSAAARIELELVGGGGADYRAELADQVARAGLGARVSFSGQVGREELSRRLARSHVLAMPSVWGEPFGRTTLEGMAHGLAVLASDAGASPEILRDGVDGRIVPAGRPHEWAQALARLEADESERLRLASQGRERVCADFSHATFVDELESRLRRAARRRSA